MTTDLEEDYQVGFKTVQSLRNLQDKTHNAFACLDASIRILTELSCIEKRVDELASSVSQLQGNINSIDSLRKRVQGIINHVSKIISISRGTTLKNAYATCIDQLTDTLNFKSQIIAQQSNKHMLGLTLETVDDSATVRVIGVVTLIYLPSTFVAVGQLLQCSFSFCQSSALNLLITDNLGNESIQIYGQNPKPTSRK